jgi:hypothetical protein
MLIKGTLHANGSLNEPIYFQGSRLEEPYKNIPGQWGAILPTPDGSGLFLGGIHFLKGSKENKLNHVIIKNANKGIQVDSVGSSTAPTLTISNSRVENMAVNCLDARTTTVLAYNTVFANSGANTVALKFGGEYEFYHCTIANYFNIKNRNEPALLLNNHFVYNKIIYPFDLKKATFGNCIIYGANEKEISLDNQYNSQAVPTDFNYTFDHCLIKITNTNQINPLNFINSIFNDDPKFSNIAEFNYSLNTLSAAIDVGKTDIANIYPLDINQVSRISDNGPDLGAIEWVE